MTVLSAILRPLRRVRAGNRKADASVVAQEVDASRERALARLAAMLAASRTDSESQTGDGSRIELSGTQGQLPARWHGPITAPAPTGIARQTAPTRPRRPRTR